MNHNKMDAQEILAINVFKQSISLLKPTVESLVSGRYNAKYGTKELITRGIGACSNNTPAEATTRNPKRYGTCDVSVPRRFRNGIQN